jgi:hypothetical protein
MKLHRENNLIVNALFLPLTQFGRPIASEEQEVFEGVPPGEDSHCLKLAIG